MPHSPKHTYRLALSLHKGMLDVLMDGAVLISQKAFDLSGNGNQISINTWADDSVYFKILEISSFSKILLRKTQKPPLL